MSDESDRTDDVIDLESARERRDKGDLPRMRAGVIVRRAFALGPICMHREIEVDSMARIVRCRACQADLDPVDALARVASEWDRLAEAVKERKRLDAEHATLKAEEKRVRARLKTAAGRCPPVDGELAALRAVERAARPVDRMWGRGALHQALLALDELRARSTPT